MLARVTAFVVWALVAAAAVFWGLRLAARPLPAPAHTVPVADAAAIAGDVTRLFGKPAVVQPGEAATPASPALASRFRLVGVMAPKPGRGEGAGLALIAIDGKPARAFRPGTAVDGDLVLQSVGLRTASLGPAHGAAAVTLEVPRLPPPAVGTLPPVAPIQPAAVNLPMGLRGAAGVPPPGAPLPPPGTATPPQPPDPQSAPPPGPLRQQGALTQ
jgi:general secretion pathway protein C